MPNFRSKMIHLAASMPKGSSERKALLDRLAGSINVSGSASEQQVQRLRHELDKHVRGAGKTTYVRINDPMISKSWTAVFDTEYAALKAFYVYRNSPSIRFGQSHNLGGWYIMVG